MCGRYGLKAWPSGLIRRLSGDPRPRAGFRARYNIAPTDSVLTVINDKSRSVAELRWELVPPVANAHGARLSTFNARIETIVTAPTYREALRTSRCAVLASGYFEWRKNPDGSKTPMWVHRRDDEPFAFAGLWATWRRGDAVLRSCTIVTQPPNEFMSSIHSRMPVVLDDGAAAAWLSPEPADAADAIALLEPQRSEEWTAHEVSSRVGNVRNDDPSLIDAVDRISQLVELPL